MSVDISVGLLRKLAASASCHVCGHFYDEPKLASCGHRMCKSCWKTKKKCSICDEDIDFNYLQDDILMVKLARSVRYSIQTFQNLHTSKDKNPSLGGDPIDNSVQVQNWLGSSQNIFSTSPTQIQPTGTTVSITSCKQATNNQVVVKTISQDDFDIIECMEEFQPDLIKEKENVMGIGNIENLLLDDEEFTKGNVSLRRSSRRKPLQEPVKPKHNTDKLMTEVIIEAHDNVKVSDTMTSEHKSSSNKHFKAHWNGVKRMRKELSKLNKRDVKKLNVSIEMCKKTQSVMSKSNACIEADVCLDPPYTIEEDTPRVVSPSLITQCKTTDYIASSSHHTISKHNVKHIKFCNEIQPIIPQEHIHYESESLRAYQSSKQNNIDDINPQEKRNSGSGVDPTAPNSTNCISPHMLTSPQKNIACDITEGKKKQENNIPMNTDAEIPKLKQQDIASVCINTTCTRNVQAESNQMASGNNDSCGLQEKEHCSVNTGNAKRKRTNIRSIAKVLPLKHRKIINKLISTNRFKPFTRYKRKYERNIGIVNVTTPEGKFVITGENICIIKPYTPCTEKSTQTEISQETNNVMKVVENKSAVHSPVPDNILTESASNHPPNQTDSVSGSANPELFALSNADKNTEKAVTNTASEDTVTRSCKIAVNNKNKFVSEIECVEEFDIFNTCSGVNRLEHVSTNTCSAFLGNTSQLNITPKSTQRTKRPHQGTDELSRKRVKGSNENKTSLDTNIVQYVGIDLPHSQNQNKRVQDVKNTTAVFNNLSHEFDEITTKAFAQIDADLYEHNNKSKCQENTNQVLEHRQENPSSDLDDNDENAFNLYTPKTTQNKIINIDSDSSFVEETPKKEKESVIQTSRNDTPQNTLDVICKNVDSTSTKNKVATQEVEAEIARIDDNMQSPLTLTFCHGIINESTPLHVAPRKSLNFGNINVKTVQTGSKALNEDSPLYQNDSGVSDLVKTTLEKEFMERAFEKTPHIAPSSRQITRRKDLKVCDGQRIQLACSCLSPDEKMEIIKFTKKQKWDFVDYYTPNLTHLIVGVDGKKAQRTAKYVYALAGGKWILSYDWISQCIKSNAIVDEAPYEVLDMSGENGPQLSRMAKTKLFEGMIFYCQPPFSILELQEIEGILETAGGRVAKNIEEVSLKNTSAVAIVIAEPQSTLDHIYTCLAIEKSVVPVNFEWAFNCLGSYSLHPLLLLCPSSLIPMSRLNWPHKLFDNSDSNDEVETQ